MSRLIDVNKFLDEEKKVFKQAHSKITDSEEKGICDIMHRKMLKMINNAPTIELIRCKDCIHYDALHGKDCGVCQREEIWSAKDEDDYCKYGTEVAN